MSDKNPFNTVWNNRPAAPTCDTLVEVSVVGRRCVYVNNYRVAGGKPYISEQLPHHKFTTTIGEVLDAFTGAQIREALREKEAREEYYAAYRAERDKGAA